MITNPKDFFQQIQNLCEGVALKVKAISDSLSSFLTKADADATYLDKTEAANTYLGKDEKAASATVADSATSANKATNDANGDNIANTYLKSTTAQSTYAPVSHTTNKSNPHGVTKAQIGLGNVTNESKATMFASPAFTGVPTAPTAAAGTNTTQVATTAFVKAAVDAKTSVANATNATNATNAVNATNATNATNDGDGNNIASTYVKTFNNVAPVNGNVSVDIALTKDKITNALGYTPLQTAPVTSVNGMTGEVTIEASASGRGVGRGGVNVHFSVASYNTYTVPSSGIISIVCSCGSDGVDVYSNGTKLFTQPYTDSWNEDDGGDAGSGTLVYQAKFTIPVNANEAIGIVYKGKDYNRLYNGKYIERIPFSGSLMQLVVV